MSLLLIDRGAKTLPLVRRARVSAFGSYFALGREFVRRGPARKPARGITSAPIQAGPHCGLAPLPRGVSLALTTQRSLDAGPPPGAVLSAAWAQLALGCCPGGGPAT